MFENTTRLQNGPNILQDLRTQQDFQQPGHLSHWSNHICGNVWKYHKIAAHAREKFKVLKPPKITKYVAMSENTTRWQATGENLTYWSNQIRGNAWKYRTIPGHKIVSNGKTLNLLKTSDMWQCWKIAQCLKIPTKDVSHGNTTRFSATELSIFEGTTRLPATEKNLTYSIWNHQHGNVWKYHKIAGHGPNILHNLKTQQNILPYLKIQQDFQPRGNIWIIEDTKYVTMFENTTRLQATGKSLSCWSHPMISIFEGPQNCQQPRKFNLLKPPKRQCSTGKI